MSEEQAVIRVNPPHCADCGAGSPRVVAIEFFDPRTGPAYRHIWLCASCEYRREHPNAVDELPLPRERSVKLQSEKLFEL